MTKRERILINYENRCHLCGHLIEGDFDVDHVVPRARGGIDGIENLAPAHPSCNRSKQAVVAHAPEVQFGLFSQRRTLKETQIKPSPVVELKGECRRWLAHEVTSATDSGLPTRFHHWLVERLRQPLTYTETQLCFLEFCKEMGVRCVVRNEKFFFVRPTIGNTSAVHD